MKNCALLAIVGLLAACTATTPANNPALGSEWDRAWSCYDLSDDYLWNPAITLFQNEYYGLVVMNDLEIKTYYQVDGLAHRWDWGWDDNKGGYRYSVLLIDDTARYHNFNLLEDGETKIEPSESWYNCRAPRGPAT